MEAKVVAGDMQGFGFESRPLIVMETADLPIVANEIEVSESARWPPYRRG